MNRILLKDIIILSLVVGALSGMLAPVPFLGTIMLFNILLFVAPIVMILLIMAGKLDLTTIKDAIIQGAIIGFCANFSFSIVYSIIVAILAKVFSINTNIILTAMIVNSPFWLILALIFFTGILFATTNAFSGFSTFYIINFIRDIYEKKQIQDNYKD